MIDTDGPGWLPGYPLQSDTLVGTELGGSAPAALIIDPSGTAHTLRLGAYIGQNWGTVTAIGPESITVTEEYQAIDGVLVVNPIVIPLGRAAPPVAPAPPSR